MLPAGETGPALSVIGARAVLVDADTVTSGPVHLAAGQVVDAPGDAAETVDATDAVVTPGLVNAHHHLLQTAFRTLPGTRGVPMAAWLPTMAAAYGAAGVDAELCGVAAPVGLAEALLCGVTTVADHHLTWPAGADTVGHGPGDRGRRRSARRAAGLRAGQCARRPRDGRDVGDRARRGAGARARGRGQRRRHAAARRRPGGRAQRRARDVPAARRGRGPVRAAAPDPGNEQVDVAVAAERYGRRPLELLDEWGWLAPDVTLAHLCDVTRRRRSQRLADAGVSATHAPGCDLPMGWGIAPVAALPDAGVAVGLGTSGGGSNDAGHLLADARLALQVAPLVGSPLAAREVLDWRPPARPTGWADPSSVTCGPGPPPTCASGTCPASPTRASPTRSPGCSGRRRAAGRGTWWWPAGWWSATAGWSGPTSGVWWPPCAPGWAADARPRGPGVGATSAQTLSRVHSSSTRRGPAARETQIIIVVPASRSSGVRTESRCSISPSSTGVSQVPQVPFRHDDTTRAPCSSTTSRMLRSSGTSTVTPVSASSTSNRLLPHGRAELARLEVLHVELASAAGRPRRPPARRSAGRGPQAYTWAASGSPAIVRATSSRVPSALTCSSHPLPVLSDQLLGERPSGSGSDRRTADGSPDPRRPPPRSWTAAG